MSYIIDVLFTINNNDNKFVLRDKCFGTTERLWVLVLTRVRRGLEGFPLPTVNGFTRLGTESCQGSRLQEDRGESEVGETR